MLWKAENLEKFMLWKTENSRILCFGKQIPMWMFGLLY